MDYTFVGETDFGGDDEVLLIVGDSQSSVPVKWADEEILLLINLYNLHEKKFSSPQYNCTNVWNVISEGFAKHDINRDGKKCAEKWRNLKKTYEKIRKHNSHTGSNRKTWKFFDELDDIFHKNPSINPVATASSSGRSIIRSESNIASPTTSETISRKNCDTPDSDTPKTRKINKRKREEYIELLEEGKEKRHREKMAQKERMFKTFIKNLFPTNNASDSE